MINFIDFKGNLINFVKIPAAHTADIFIKLLFPASQSLLPQREY